jgi:hypothetical protein
MPQLMLDGIGTASTNGNLSGHRAPVMPTTSPPATLADRSDRPLRFVHSLTMRLDAQSLTEVERLAEKLGSTKGTVACRLFHLGLRQVLVEDTNAVQQIWGLHGITTLFPMV